MDPETISFGNFKCNKMEKLVKISDFTNYGQVNSVAGGGS